MRPTLLIGLGGPGRCALTHVKKGLLDVYEGTMPEGVRFLAMDTTSPEKPVEVGGVPLSNEEVLVFGESLYPLIRRISSSPERYPHLSKWWPAHLYANLSEEEFELMAGAEEQRVLGRLALFADLQGGTNNSKLWARMRSHLERLWPAQPQETPQVFLIGALGENAGSGMLLDVAYLARQAGCDVRSHQEIRVDGFLISQGIFQALGWSDTMAPNTFAAMREVERFLLALDKPYPMVYTADPGAGQPLVGTSEQRIFDRCFLLDGDRSGHSLVGRPPEEGFYPAIADCIVSFLDPDASRVFGRHFQNVPQEAGRLQAQREQGMVSSLGSFAYVLPLEELLQAAEYRFLRQLLDTFLQVVTSVDGHSLKLGREAHREEPSASTAVPDFMRRGGQSRRPPPLLADLADFIESGTWNQDEIVNAMGWIGDPTDYLKKQRRHFQACLEERLSDILNGRSTDAIVARSGKLGYALDFVENLADCLEKVRRRARTMKATTRSEEAEVLVNAINEYGLVVAEAQEELADWAAALLDGMRPSRGETRGPLLWVVETEASGQGLYRQLCQRYEEVIADRQRLSRVMVRRYLLEEKVEEDIYQRYLKNRLAEGLERLLWETDISENRLQLNLVLVSEREEELSKEPEAVDQNLDKLLGMADIFGQAARQESVTSSLQLLFTPQELAEQLREWSGPLVRWGDEARDRRLTYFLCVDDEVYGRQLQQELGKHFHASNVVVVPTQNRRVCALITVADNLPLPALRPYEQAREDYLFHPSRDTLHVFAAEQHAAGYEAELPKIHEATRLFHPHLTILLEDREWAEAFVLCYAYGHVRLEKKEREIERYRLELPSPADLDVYLTRPQEEPSLLAAMERFVLHREGFSVEPGYQARIEWEAIQEFLKQKHKLPTEGALASLDETLKGRELERLRQSLRQAERDLASFIRLVVREEQGRLKG